MAGTRADDLTTITGFLTSIGLSTREGPVDGGFLPGIAVVGGDLVYDPALMRSPGDLLHEAGHLALLSRAERTDAEHSFGDDGGQEVGAIAWSWAALTHLGLPAEVVFHEHGYRDGARALIENFSAGRWIGVPILEWRGLAATGERAEALGVAPFPAMIRWLRP